ncbi:hypothetical protein RHGRI_037073 [Rhododendron griersonianum]|uniref:Pollen Ole e 1 allergen and extensin family protein n=1 Tax=Rhododendron griersonianum TaxID=479676 RepID=A0AAV6HU53_9ERIC|nr:hypothetical protein RHGRI_037073 [Rhododendron griersonianum]
MLSHFHGCNNLVTMIMTFIPIFFFFLFGSSPAAAAGREINPLVEISSREDLMQMAGYGEERLSTVLISGTVFCHETCQGEKARIDPHPVSGALVAVSCHTSGKTSKSNWVEVSTDEFGDFLIDLPSHLHAIPNLGKRCVVKVLRLPKHSLCHPAFTGNQTVLKLSSSGNGIRTYTAESLNLSPKPSEGCTKETPKKKVPSEHPTDV